MFSIIADFKEAGILTWGQSRLPNGKARDLTSTFDHPICMHEKAIFNTRGRINQRILVLWAASHTTQREYKVNVSITRAQE